MKSIGFDMKRYRIAVIIIRNKAGEFFIHQRRDDKDRFPGLYGLGAGGKIEDGEQPKTGAARELLEETGIQAVPNFLFQYEYRDDDAIQDTFVYAVQAENIPTPSDNEWQWSGWRSLENIQEHFDGNKFCLDDYPLWDRYRAQVLQDS